MFVPHLFPLYHGYCFILHGQPISEVEKLDQLQKMTQAQFAGDARLRVLRVPLFVQRRQLTLYIGLLSFPMARVAPFPHMRSTQKKLWYRDAEVFVVVRPGRW